MPIKYPSKYPPKYYNSNWSQWSHEKISWDYHMNNKNKIKKSNKIPITKDADTIDGKFPKYK